MALTGVPQCARMTSNGVPPGVDGIRDGLLALARQLVADTRVTADGDEIGRRFRSACALAIHVDPEFEPDPVTGVEAMAFVVDAGPAGTAGGLLLRLPGELPDSFEAVAAPSSPDPAAVRRAFFRDA